MSIHVDRRRSGARPSPSGALGRAARPSSARGRLRAPRIERPPVRARFPSDRPRLGAHTHPQRERALARPGRPALVWEARGAPQRAHPPHARSMYVRAASRRATRARRSREDVPGPARAAILASTLELGPSAPRRPGRARARGRPERPLGARPWSSVAGHLQTGLTARRGAPRGRIEPRRGRSGSFGRLERRAPAPESAPGASSPGRPAPETRAPHERPFPIRPREAFGSVAGPNRPSARGEGARRSRPAA